MSNVFILVLHSGKCGPKLSMFLYFLMLKMWFEHEVYVYHMWVEDLMLLSCILHTSSFAWKFCRDHMVRPYRYTPHHTLPEEGYDVAS
jgi:hypothetical protein